MQASYEKYAKIRDARGEVDNQVAVATKIPRSCISEWKSGRSVPKADKIYKIACHLGTTIEDLMEPGE